LSFPNVSPTVTTLTIGVTPPAEIFVVRDSTLTTGTLTILDLKAVVAYAVVIMG
jgi:hypothetical protein